MKFFNFDTLIIAQAICCAQKLGTNPSNSTGQQKEENSVLTMIFRKFALRHAMPPLGSPKRISHASILAMGSVTQWTGTRRNMTSFGSHESSTPVKTIDYSTLHELQRAACDKFSSNPLFGTYNHVEGAFQYQSYSDFEREVNRCRSVLRNIGRF